MPSRRVNRGMMLVICPYCGFVFAHYDLSPSKRSERYNGTPILRRSVESSDSRISEDGTFTCPFCGGVLAITPGKILVYPYKKVRNLIRIELGSKGGRVKVRSVNLMKVIAGREYVDRILEMLFGEAYAPDYIGASATATPIEGSADAADLAAT